MDTWCDDILAMGSTFNDGFLARYNNHGFFLVTGMHGRFMVIVKNQLLFMESSLTMPV
jgi:hypothetical protein